MSPLWSQGGMRRFYAGLAPALLQGPLARFGDTAANVGVLTLLDASPSTKDLPVVVKTLAASAGAATWRIILMPIDTVKSIMQVEGAKGLPMLREKMAKGGPLVLFYGGVGASVATFAGHYPWFATYNLLDSKIPVPTDRLQKLGRNAFMGFTASVISDSVSNSFRVLKTYRQTSPTKVSYMDAAQQIIAKDGVKGLLGRGLSTRIATNGLQGLMFSVLWKFFDEKLHKPKEKSPA